MAEFTFDKLVICGVGLIGGSLAGALRRGGRSGGGAVVGAAGKSGQPGQPGGRGWIIGIDRAAGAAQDALDLGLIDQACDIDDPTALAAALADADLVVLAAPVAQTAPLLARLAPHLGPHTVLTDVGSTKTDVAAAARAALGPALSRFVPGHPIVGRERSGVHAALDDLFVERHVVLCPLPDCAPDALARVAGMWQAAGARTQQMSCAEHDRILAAVSHLPHLLAFGFMLHLLDVGDGSADDFGEGAEESADDAERKLALAAGGFRDFTRIAASSPEMWRDICLANRAALLAELDGFSATLAGLRQALEQQDGAVLEQAFTRAARCRAAWGEQGGAAATAPTDMAGKA